jgi:hypothetical protein
MFYSVNGSKELLGPEHDVMYEETSPLKWLLDTSIYQEEVSCYTEND